MKLKFYFPVILCLVGMAYSCKKDKGSEGITTGKTYPVTISVGVPADATTFVQAAGRNLVTSVATPLPASAVVGNIIYQLYGKNGLVQHLQLSDSTAANFGTFYSNLPAGSYTMFVLGNALSTFATGSRTGIGDYLINPGKDFFYGQSTFTVSDTGSNMKSITLTRLTEKLVMKSNNVVPNNIDSLTMKIYEKQLYRLDDLTPVVPSQYYTRILHHTFTAAERGMANFQMSSYVYCNKTDVTITEYFQGAVIKTIALTDVHSIRNQVTTGTGAMFIPDAVTTHSVQTESVPVWNYQASNF